MLLVCAALAGCLGAEESTPAPEIAPYLLRLAPDSAVLCWVTPDERRSEGTLTSLQGRRIFSDTSPVRFHRQLFEGLRPATTYRYIVDDVFSGAFRTPEASNEFRLVVLGTHARLRATRSLPGRAPHSARGGAESGAPAAYGRHDVVRDPARARALLFRAFPRPSRPHSGPRGPGQSRHDRRRIRCVSAAISS